MSHGDLLVLMYGTVYVVAITKEVAGSVTNFYNRLHALDVTTGAEKFGGPALIQSSVPGVGDGNDGHGNVPFVQLKHHQRSSLLFQNGTVYIPFTGHLIIRHITAGCLPTTLVPWRKRPSGTQIPTARAAASG